MTLFGVRQRLRIGTILCLSVFGQRTYQRVLLPICFAGMMPAATPISAAEFVRLGGLSNDPESRAAAISEDGLVVAGRSMSASGNQEVFRWTRETGMTSLESGNYSTAPIMSADGAVVVFDPPTHIPGTPLDYAVRIWSETNGLTEVDADTYFSNSRQISADGAVVANLKLGNPPQAARWSFNEGISVLSNDGGENFVRAVSADGTAIAGVDRVGIDHELFRWTANEGMVSLGEAVPGDNQTSPTDISADGSVVFGLSRSRIYSPQFGNTYGPMSLWRWTTQSGMDVLYEGTTLREYAGESIFELPRGRRLSADGSVFVGRLTNGDGSGTVFRWTEKDGLVEFPHFPGYTTSQIHDLTPDGAWMFGSSQGRIDPDDDDSVGWLWHEQTGMLNIVELLRQQGLGPDFDDWQRLAVGDADLLPLMSANARAILATGINPEGNYEAWVAYLDPLVALSGDFNHDGVVNSADYTVWRDELGTTYTQGDYDTWKTNLGAASAAGLGSFATVPEPASTALGILAVVCCPPSCRPTSRRHQRIRT